MTQRIVFVLPIFLLVGCRGSDAGEPSIANPPVSPTLDPATTIAHVVGPEGGTVAIGGASVTIPPGALTATVMITIDRVAAPSGREEIEPWFDFGPSGIVFEKPVAIAIEAPEGLVRGGGTPTVVKHISHPAFEGDGEETALMVLDTTWDAATRIATGSTIGFSNVAVEELPCGATTEPVLAITSAQWDPCARETHLEWRSGGRALLEYGYRQGYGNPVHWSGAWQTSGTMAHDFPAFAGPAPAGQIGYTWVFKLHSLSVCSGTTYAYDDVVGEVPAFEVLPPDPPTDTVAERVANDRVQVRWLDPQAPEALGDGYEIHRSPAFRQAGWVDVAGTIYDDREVDPSGDYSYAIRSYRSACGRRLVSRSALATTSTTAAPPSQVQGLTATAVSPTSVRLDWMPAARALEYVIERAGGAAMQDVVVTAPDVAWVDASAEPGTAYTYTLTAQNADGSSSPVTASATTPAVMTGSAECGDVRLTVMPTTLTTHVQNVCNPGDPGCPDDAVFDVLVERLGGSTADVHLSVQLGDDAAWPVLELQLGMFGGRSGAPYVTLTDGLPAVTTTYEVRTPSYAFMSMPAPVIWNLVMEAQTPGTAPMCRVPFTLEVQP